jgi:phage tail sheath gpL-like
MPPIDFDTIPTGLRVPHIGVEFNGQNAQQGSGIQTYRGLLIGQRLTAGTVAELVPTRITSANQAGAYFGFGSALHRMALRWFDSNKSTELWAVAQDDTGGSAAATGTITFSGTPTASGTLAVWIAGTRIPLTITPASTPTSVAADLAAKVTAATSLPVSASANVGAVTLTAKNKGTLGNVLDLRVNHLSGESTPAGLGVAVVAMSGGAGDPDITDVWPVIAGEQFHILAVGYVDATSRTALDAELTTRWGPMAQIEGHAFQGYQGTHGALLSLGDALNSKHLTIVGFKASPSPAHEWAAAVAADVAFYGAAAPTRPFQTLVLEGIVAPKVADRFTLEERDLLLHDGISTFNVSPDGKVLIESLITTYQENGAGAEDTSFLSVNTLLALSYIRWSWRNRILLKFPRHRLAADGKNYGPGLAIVTPSILKAEAIGWFRDLEELGIVEDVDQFKRDVVVEINAGNPNRADMILPPNLVNQFHILATRADFLV